MNQEYIQKGRRRFIKKCLVGITGLFVLPSCVRRLSLGSMTDNYRILGRTKLRLPVVSFGVSHTENELLIKKAIDSGIKYLDTAHGYLGGKNETAIGRTLKKMGKREEVYIGTKLNFARDNKKEVYLTEGSSKRSLATEKNFYKLLDISLKRLQTDYVDILYLHSCLSPKMVNFKPLMKAIVKAKESRKTKFIGVSTHRNEPEVIRAAVDANIYDVVLVSYNHLHKRKNEIKEANRYAAKNGVGIIAMKVMAGNRLKRDESFQINQIAALRWVLNDKNVTTTIPGMTTFEQLEQNLKIMNDLTLRYEEKRELKLSSMVEDTLYCQNCRKCVSTCPKDVEIPALMRAFMYAEGYPDYYMARETITHLPLNYGLEVCRDCEDCKAICPNGLQISERISSLIEKGFSRVVAV